jgi:hypothetical protein
VFLRLAKQLFATNVDASAAVRLVGFRLGQLEIPLTKQTLLFDEDE